MILDIIGGIGPFLIGAVIAIGGVIVAYSKGRSAGASKAKIKDAEAKARNQRIADEKRREVDGISSDDLDQRLRRWGRD